MSKYFSEKFSGIAPYVPGEQPKNKLIKLNTNESPFPPSPLAMRLARQAVGNLQLYSDPNNTSLKAAAAEVWGIEPNQILFTNGSDEGLNFAVAAYCDSKTKAVFADVTYGFYPVFCNYNRVPYVEIPLKEDFTIDVDAFCKEEGTVLLANPNAQTGVYLPLAEVEKIVASNPNRVVVIDEAYIDFAEESAVKLLPKYENLLVVGTFSKSRSLAGARLGYVIGAPALLADINALIFCTNPFNVNPMTEAAGVGALLDTTYFQGNCEKIKENRAYLTRELERLGFTTLPSAANFVLTRHPEIEGAKLYAQLKEKGILVRHFAMPRISAYIRITIGSKEELTTLVEELEKLL